MTLADEVKIGQDVEVDAEGKGTSRQLRVAIPSWGPMTVFADRRKYLEQRKQTQNPDIEAVCLNSLGYRLDSEKAVSLRTPLSQSSTITLRFGQETYEELRRALEMSEDAKKVTEMVNQMRVVINSDGEALSYGRAEREHNITPDIVFIRGDGWALGARQCDRSIAYKMWTDSWTHFYVIAEQKLRPISEYTSYSLTERNDN